MKILLVLVTALVLLVGVILLIGALLPRKHVASREIVLRQSAHDVYALARGFASAATWRSDVKSVELLAPANGRLRFREDSTNGRITYELVEELPDAKLVTEIVDRDLGYFGSWTYEFLPEGNGTRVRITENGEVPNVLFRSMSRFAFGHTTRMDGYLRALGRKFGEDVTPQ